MHKYRGAELRKLRAMTGISQRKMAELLEVKRSTYQAWELDANPVCNLAFETIKRFMIKMVKSCGKK